MVYPADYGGDSEGGSVYAAKDFPKRRNEGQEAVPDIGEQALSWPNDFHYRSRYLAFQRGNAVVSVELGGYDCCQDYLGIAIDDARLRDVVTRAAREIDQKLQSIG